MQRHSVVSRGGRRSQGEQKDVLPLSEGFVQSRTAQVKAQRRCVDTGSSMWLLWFGIRCTDSHGINVVPVCDPSLYS